MKRLALLAIAALGTAHAAIREEIVTLPSVEGGAVPYLKSWDDEKRPRAIAILFTGSWGVVGLATRGIPKPGANFLVRSRHIFIRDEVATAVIDVPSGMAQMSDTYRMSKAHADDVGSVAEDMKRQFGALPVYLVGTSRGTVSAAYAGAALQSRIDGVVLTSSMFNAARSGPGISTFDYGTLRSRLLFVHHVDDGCEYTPHHMAESRARGRTLISVSGGQPPKSGPCDPFSPHGFFGVEDPTVRAIVGWMLRGEAPGRVP